jgi:3-methyladenine DNA glycosylase AlkD
MLKKKAGNADICTMTTYQQQADEIKTHLGSFSGSIPVHRRESKRVYSFSKLPFSEQLAIWDHIWRTHSGFYPRLHAYFFLERHLKKENELLEMWPVIVNWQDEVDDWPLCDALAKVYTRILEVLPAEVYAQLKEWNTDADQWKRRQSVVSLLYYSRTKRRYLSFEQITALITPLLGDKEYYVQKAVGWTLRELHNVYPEQALEYLKQHVKQISGMALTTAVEKMDAATVLELRTARKMA